MPKVSKADKIAPRGTKPGDAPHDRDRPDKYLCSRCGKAYIRQKSNFPASQSPLYKDAGYLPVCNNCVDNLFDHYKEALGSGEAAMRRICMKFDIYWDPEIYGMLRKVNSSASRVKQYISKTFLIRYIGKSFDDTLDEENAAGIAISFGDVANAIENSDGGETPESVMGVAPETVLFWGAGFDENTYKELDMRFERWTKDLVKPLPIVEESLYKQICIQETQINRKAALGQDVEKGQSALNNLLSSLNMKPSQQKDDDGTGIDGTPLGVWAKRWEENRPIPDDVPDSNIVGYITTWLFGHLSKAFGLKNVHSKMYDAEIEKYRVTKPEFEGEDDDEIIVDIFGNGDGGGDTG